MKPARKPATRILSAGTVLPPVYVISLAVASYAAGLHRAPLAAAVVGGVGIFILHGAVTVLTRRQNRRRS